MGAGLLLHKPPTFLRRLLDVAVLSLLLAACSGSLSASSSPTPSGSVAIPSGLPSPASILALTLAGLIPLAPPVSAYPQSIPPPAAQSPATPAYVEALGPSGFYLVPLDIATNILGTPIALASGATRVLGLSPDGSTAYVSTGSVGNLDGSGQTPGYVVPIDLATGIAKTPIPTPSGTWAVGLAATPASPFAYVITSSPGLPIGDQGDVLPIDLATNAPSAAIPLPPQTAPVAIALTPDGQAAYVATAHAAIASQASVLPLDLATSTFGHPITLPTLSTSQSGIPLALAISPDGSSAYVALATFNQNSPALSATAVIPINLATASVGATIRIGDGSGDISALSLTPDGKTAYASLAQGGDTTPFTFTVVPIDLATKSPGSPLPLPSGTTVLGSLAITPDGTTGYAVAQSGPSTAQVLPIDLASATPGSPLAVPSTLHPIAVLIAPSPPTSPAPPAGACLPKSPPKVVVVMARGLTSSIADPTAGQAQDWYNPLSLDQCHASSSPNAALRGLGFNEFDQPALDGSQSLMAAIAATGALILPYSYNGAYFIPNAAHKPEFHVNAYSGFDTFNEIIASAQVLDYELVSIRQQWPTAKLILIGHSEGGEVMKQWWRNWDGHHGVPDHATSNWNVAGVYSLDSPINGGPGPETLCSYLQVLLPPSTGFCQGAIATSLFGEYSALWYDFALSQQDDTAMALSAVGDRAIYTPVGTRGDVVMEMLSFTALPNPFNSGQELSPQLLAQFNSSGQIDTLIDPGRLTPTQAGSLSQGLSSHQVVYEDPQNIQFLASAVSQADLGPHPYVQVAHFSPLLPPSPTARLQNPAALPGATITIQGQLLGSSPGALALLSSPTQPPQRLVVSAWSATAITASLPPGATSGMVVGQTAQGQPFFAGLLTVLTGSSSATHIQVDPVPSTEDGQPLTLTIHVTGSNGQPLANAPLTLSDGLVQSHAQSDAAGRAAFTLTGSGDQALVVFSGAAYAAVQITRTPKPRLAITLSLSPAHPVPGEVVVATATVRDAQGHPISGVQVLFSALGPAQPAFAGSSALATNASGRASARLLPALPAQALVTASVPGSLASVGLVVDWQAASTTASVLPWWPLLPALLSALAAGFFFWRRRAKRPARA